MMMKVLLGVAVSLIVLITVAGVIYQNTKKVDVNEEVAVNVKNPHNTDYAMILANQYAGIDEDLHEQNPLLIEFRDLWNVLTAVYPRNTEDQCYRAIHTVYGLKTYYPGTDIKTCFDLLIAESPNDISIMLAQKDEATYTEVEVEDTTSDKEMMTNSTTRGSGKQLDVASTTVGVVNIKVYDISQVAKDLFNEHYGLIVENQLAYQEALVKQQQEVFRAREAALSQGLKGAQSRGQSRIQQQQEAAALKEMQRQQMNMELKRYEENSIAGSRARELNNR